MHKDRSLSEDEKAVSAVIAVALMVAVAVAMAAVAYAYFTGIIGGRGGIEADAVIEFTPYYDENTLTFTYSDTSNIDWSDLTITGEDLSTPPSTVDLVNANSKSGIAEIGEKIFVDGKGVGGTVVVTIVYDDVLMGSYTFEDVDP